MSSVGRKACYAMIFVALFAIITFGIVCLVSDDSSAVSNNVYSGSDPNPIGYFELSDAGHTLNIFAFEPSDVTSVTLDDSFDKGLVDKIIIDSFKRKIVTSFTSDPGYTSLDEIVYQGNIDPTGTWMFIAYSTVDGESGVLSITASGSTATGIEIQRFKMESDVVKVVITGFDNDLSGTFNNSDYTSLGKNIIYTGTVGDDGIWTFDFSNDTLTVDKNGATSSQTPGSWGTTGPFNGKFFASKALSLEYRTFTQDSKNLFEGMTAARYLKATDFVGNTTNILYGLSITTLEFEKLSNVNAACYGAVSGTLEIFKAPGAQTISEGAFQNNTKIHEIYLDSLRTINRNTFNGCISLTKVYIPDVTTINEYAFYNCEKLSDIDISAVSSIGNHSFDGCALLPSLSLPGITSLGEYAFSNCSGLNTIEIGTVRTIPTGAFSACTSLHTVTFISGVSGVRVISDNAFNGCTSLNSITLGEVTTIGNNAFANTANLGSIDLENVTLIGNRAFYKSATGGNEFTVHFGSNLSTIGTEAFRESGISGIIVFPATLSEVGIRSFYMTPIGSLVFTSESNIVATTEIKENAFQYSGVTSVEFGNGVKEIYHDAFNGCSSLETVIFREGIETIGERAFYDCTRIGTTGDSKIVLPATLSTLGEYAFSGSSSGASFRTLEINGGSLLRIIPEGAFYKCYNLENSVQFPDSVEEIGMYAFKDTSLSGAIFNTVTSNMMAIGNEAFANTSITLMTIPCKVTTIGDRAFANCRISELALNQKLVTVGEGAFQDNEISELVIPNTSADNLILSANLFNGCRLEKIYISSSVKEISANAFRYLPSSGRTVDIWFNGVMNEMNIASNAFVFNNNVTVNIHADSTSSTRSVVESLVSFGKISGTTKVKYNPTFFASSIDIRNESDGELTYPKTGVTVRAIYGSKIVLPYVEGNTNYSTTYFAVYDNRLYLMMFASEADYGNDKVAQSGYSIYVYPLGENDTLDIRCNDDKRDFVKNFNYNTVHIEGDQEIEYTSEEVSNGSGSSHYGATITIPRYKTQMHLVIDSIMLDSYVLNPELPTLISGHCYQTFTLKPRDDPISVIFYGKPGDDPSSKGDYQQKELFVKYGSLFDLSDTTDTNIVFVKSMETPELGFEFTGWYTKQIGGTKATPTTPFLPNDKWYAHYVPIEYSLEIRVEDKDGQSKFTITKDVYGPLTLSLDKNNGLISYTDERETDKNIFNISAHVPGYSVSNYNKVIGYNSQGKPIKQLITETQCKFYGNEFPTEEKKVEILIVVNEVLFDFYLDFVDENGNPLTGEIFKIEDWGIGKSETYTCGSHIDSVAYSKIENGLIMPLPLNENTGFRQMCAVYTEYGVKTEIPLQIKNGNYQVTSKDFRNQNEITIRYHMDSSSYVVKYDFDIDGVQTIQRATTVKVNDSFLIEHDARDYPNTGYRFIYYTIEGSEYHYDFTEGEGVISTVTVTTSMAQATTRTWHVIVIKANWTENEYSLIFNDQHITSKSTTVHDGNNIYIAVANHPSIITVDDDKYINIQAPYTGCYIKEWRLYRGSDSKWSDPIPCDEQGICEIIINPNLIENYVEKRTTAVDSGTLTLVPVWYGKTYTLTYEGSDHTDDFEITYVIDGQQHDVNLWHHDDAEFITFRAWRIGNSYYANGAMVPFNNDMAAAGDTNDNVIRFVPVWKDIEYYIEYDKNEGSGRMDKTGPYSLGIISGDGPSDFSPPSGAEFSRYGYYPDGWNYYNKDGIQTRYVGDGKFDTALASSANGTTITLFVNWQPLRYNIEYENVKDVGGKMGRYQPTEAAYGTVTISFPTRTGYQFTGWTAKGLTGDAKYQGSNSVIPWKNDELAYSETFYDLCWENGITVTLRANWKVIEYEIIYDSNGGEVMDYIPQKTVISMTDKDGFLYPDVIRAEKTGYTLSGWGLDRVNPISSGTRLTKEMIPAESDSITLYAIWKSVRYHVQYRYTDDYDYSTVDAEYSDNVYISMPSRVGYTFAGWSVQNAGPNAQYSKDGGTNWYILNDSTDGDAVFRKLCSADDGVVKLDAKWEAKEYRIAYNANGGTGKPPIDPKVYKVGDSITMMDYKSLIGTNGSKTVIGWSLEVNGTSVNLTDFTTGLCSVADATNTVNLYAVWVNDMCLVIVNLDGASVSSTPSGWSLNADGTYEKLVNYGTSTKDALSDWDSVVLSKDGYSFSGWDYESSTVMSTVIVTPDFEKVNMNVLYIFAGVVGVFAVGAIVITKL